MTCWALMVPFARLRQSSSQPRLIPTNKTRAKIPFWESPLWKPSNQSSSHYCLHRHFLGAFQRPVTIAWHPTFVLLWWMPISTFNHWLTPQSPLAKSYCLMRYQRDMLTLIRLTSYCDSHIKFITVTATKNKADASQCIGFLCWLDLFDSLFARRR